jgi:hypothetical protein
MFTEIIADAPAEILVQLLHLYALTALDAFH